MVSEKVIRDNSKSASQNVDKLIDYNKQSLDILQPK